MTFLKKWKNADHIKYRYRVIDKLVFIKVLWELFHPNIPIIGEF